MDPYQFYTGEKPSPPPLQSSQQPLPRPPPPPQKKQNQIQGPRPTALKVHHDSHKIKKPPLPPPPQQPVIIYAVSPKVIHIKESEFMTVVQRLTGLSSGDFSSGDGQVSPAARLAATEKASPRERNPNNSNPDDGGSDNDLMAMIESVEIGQIPGILSPAPAMLSPVPPGFFSPITDPNFFNDVMLSSSPYGNNYGSNFILSPSSLLSASNILSPLPSPDLFNLLMDL
ncbi:protein MKS1 [Ricinus communis]|uniref:protein MKS1 n=1 Tax=Ricinus communis TaxID=3988 RepID=UPI00201B214D|nr:protein MKS1 [Ricinus communis]